MTATATSLEVHPIASLFPMMTDEEFAGLKADMQAHGLREPITIYDGKVLDGRNRLRACEELDFAPTTKQFHGEPIEFVISQNLHRRHLSVSQRAMIAGRAREMYDAQAKQRMALGGGDKRSVGAKSGMAKLPDPIKGRTARDEAGKAVGVGGRTVDTATKVLREAEPELIKAVDEGKITVNRAEKLLAESPEVQRAEASNPTNPRKQDHTPGTHQTNGDSTRDAYLEMLEAIYNYGRKQLVGLKSASIMAMRERNACKGKGKTTNSVQATA